MKNRVVVTGIGMITPLGVGVEKNWLRLCEGNSGVGNISYFDTSAYKVKIAGEVRDFEPSDFIPRKEIKKMDRFIQLAVAAGIIAVEDAGLKISASEAEQVGVVLGTGIGGLPAIEKYHKVLLRDGVGRVTPFFIPMLIPNLAPGQIALRFGFKGPNFSTVTACASGAHAIGEAFRIIQRGEATVMVTGGSEAVITPLGVAGFSAMKALSTRNDEPKRASRPFDKKRDGFVMSEGAGILVLEELSHAIARSAKIYAELVGFGMSADAYHISTPHPEGNGAAQAIRLCLQDAGLTPNEVDYINAHGTSTILNDKQETQAIKQVFGEYAQQLAVSSVKSMLGHLLGAAGGVEAIATILSIVNGVIPPTINYEEQDPDCDLDYVPNKARPADLAVALSNSFGFGGANASIAFKAM